MTAFFIICYLQEYPLYIKFVFLNDFSYSWFDNSYKRGEPLQIPVSGVIAGWVQALQLMPVGSKWKLFIPSDLGYGDRGAGGSIPGGATLIFDIELLEIINRPK